MDEAKAPPPKIKVVDRRKFTVEGEARENSPSPDSEPEAREGVVNQQPSQSAVSDDTGPQPPPSPEVEAAAEPRPATADGSESSPDFIELVLMLAQQAELLLVGGEGFPAQPDQAKRTIDYLGVLESKTQGNLSAEEGRVLSNIVFQLRTAYLQRK